MNEILFFIQIILVVGFAVWALKLGKEALVSWVAIQALIANLFVLKQITLFGFFVTASDAFAIGSLLGLSFLQEYYGKDEAKKATWICFFFMIFFVLASQLHLFYEPSLHDTTQGAYHDILSQSPRLLAASMGVFFIVQRIDIRFFAFLKNFLPGTGFAWRAAMTLVVSQFIDTALFSIFGLYGLVASIFDVVIVSFLIKLLVILVSASAIRWAKG